VRAAHRQVLVSVPKPVHRRDDPASRAKGWPIGSGPVASACTPVVGQRLTGRGLGWGEAGADARGHLRALFRSPASPGDAFWASAA
jgi:hypothetical protein